TVAAAAPAVARPSSSSSATSAPLPLLPIKPAAAAAVAAVGPTTVPTTLAATSAATSTARAASGKSTFGAPAAAAGKLSTSTPSGKLVEAKNNTDTDTKYPIPASIPS